VAKWTRQNQYAVPEKDADVKQSFQMPECGVILYGVVCLLHYRETSLP